jgi:hypothetical protein
MAELTRNRSLTSGRTLGAIALLLVGGIHYQQYRYAFYSSVPTIGPLFLANFVGATALGLLLLAPGKLRLGRLGNLLKRLTALAGVGLAASGLAALLISEHTPLFGFMEHGYRFVIVLTIASEAVAIALLTLFLVRTTANRGRRLAKRGVTPRSDTSHARCRAGEEAARLPRISV